MSGKHWIAVTLRVPIGALLFILFFILPALADDALATV